MNIDICVPSRGRPDRLEKMITSIKETVSSPKKVNVFVRVDMDDEPTMDRLLGKIIPKNKFVHATLGDRLSNLGDMWNECAKAGKGEIIGMAGDDTVFTQPGWDHEVRQEFAGVPDSILLVYGPDGINDRKQVTHPFVSRKSIEVLGYYLPSCFPILYVDTWLEEIYTLVGRKKYNPKVAVEHQHFSKYPELMDETYAEPRRKGLGKVAQQQWRKTAGQRELDAQRLQDYLWKAMQNG